MANETENSNFTQVAAYVSEGLAPVLRAASVMMPLVTIEDVPAGSKSKLFKGSGSLTMAAHTESNNTTISEYTETSATATLVANAVYTELSDEAEEFQSEDRLNTLIQEAGQAAAQFFDVATLALFDGFATTAGSTGTDLDIAAIKTALYKLSLNNAKGKRAFVAHPTALHDAFGGILSSTGTVYGTGLANQVLDAQEKPAGYAGTFLNVPFFETTNTKSVNSAADWACGAITPYAMGVVMRPSLKVKIGYNVQKMVHELSVIMYMGAVEWKDLCGVYVLADQ